MSADNTTIQNRSEIVFLYDAVDTNPNGDPLTEENRPRVDDYTGEAIVTDVRLKRVVRDYLDREGNSILVKASGGEARDDKNDRYAELFEQIDEDDKRDVIDAFLDLAADVRLFGDSMAFDDSPTEQSFTGPVQFNFGRSMHSVHEVTHGKTSVLAADSEDGGAGGNMFSEHRIAYAMMRFHGVVDENAATTTNLDENDLELLEDGLWYGTRELTNTSSKRGHEPRLLLRVEYTDDEYHIGDLHRSIGLDPQTDGPKAMRDVSHATIKFNEILGLLDEHQDRIEHVYVRVSRRLEVNANGEEGGPETLETALHSTLGDEGVTVRYD
jgi:CRISPR-associated protein Csh2